MSEYAVDESTIFETPLVKLDLDIESDADVYAKAEWFNLYDAPARRGSIKSRIAKGMIDGAEERGDPRSRRHRDRADLRQHRQRDRAPRRVPGYDVEIVMPDNAAGGKVDAVRDAGAGDPLRRRQSRLRRRHRALRGDHRRRPRGVLPAEPVREPRQPRYPRAHDRSRDLRGDGRRGDPLRRRRRYRGTITGTGRGLTDLSDGAVEIVGFEPDEQLHAIDGLKYLKSGDHYHPDTYDESALDRTEYVTTSDAYDRARALRERYLNREIEIADPGQHDEATIREHLRVDDQFVVGTSAGGGGAAAVAGLDEAGALADDDVVVFMLCDRGDKYADIPLWEEYL